MSFLIQTAAQVVLRQAIAQDCDAKVEPYQ
jgi:hypothetical protein